MNPLTVCKKIGHEFSNKVVSKLKLSNKIFTANVLLNEYPSIKENKNHSSDF